MSEPTHFYLLQDWIKAVESGDPASVVACYAPDAVLLPTISKRIRLTQEERLDYFQTLLSHEPKVSVDTVLEREWGQVSILSGIYRFLLKGAAEAKPARFSFVFVHEGPGERDWVIKEHHSSWMPEGE